MVGDASNLYVVGNDVLFYDRPLKVGETLTTWRVGYGSLGTPAPDLAFAFPKAVLDVTGRLHMLWGEPVAHEQTIPPHQWLLLRTSSIWTAAYEPERGWSRPARIHSGPIAWSRATSGGGTGGAKGEGLVVVPNLDGGVLVLALRDGRWTVTAVPGRTEPAYASVLDLESRRLLAVVTADTTQVQDRNSLFLYSQDGDGPWRPIRQVQRSGTQPAMEVRLLKAAGGRVHLVWRQMLREDYLVIRHTQSDDGGASWTEPSDFVPRGLIQNINAAVDNCGRLHVVYEDWSDGPGAVRIGYATRDAEWSPPQRLHPDYIAAEFALVPRADGSLLIAFLGTSGKPDDRNGWQMLYSEFR